MENIDKNPTVYVNPSQPLMASVEVRSQSMELNEALFNVDGLAVQGHWHYLYTHSVSLTYISFHCKSQWMNDVAVKSPL